MNDIVVKTCVGCNTKKRFENFNKKYSDCKSGNLKRV